MHTKFLAGKATGDEPVEQRFSQTSEQHGLLLIGKSGDPLKSRRSLSL